MDPRLLRYYNQELQHLREMGAEFAREFPKIAARLGMEGIEVTDPYVERLLEGVAFLAARVQLKLDAEFPRFTAAPARDRLPELPGADAGDAARAVPAGSERGEPRARLRRPARRRAARPARQGRSDRVRVPHRARRHALAARDHRRRVLLLRARPAASAAAGCGPRSKGACASSSGRRPASPSTRWGSTGCACSSPARTRSPTSSTSLRSAPRRASWSGRWRSPGRGTSSCPLRGSQRAGYRRLGSAAAGRPADVPGLSAPAGVLLVSAAVPVRRRNGTRERGAAAARGRARARVALRAGRPGARERGRRLELRAPLHAGHQPVRKACGPHPPDGGHLRLPRRPRPDPPDGLRGVRGHRRDRVWRRVGQRAIVPAVLCGVSGRRRRATTAISPCSASRACCRRGSGARDSARATSAARSSSRSSIRTRRPGAATCGSSA